MATEHTVRKADEYSVELLPSDDDDAPSPLSSSWRLSLETFRLPSSLSSTGRHDGRTRFSRYFRTPRKERKVSEYYKKQERLLEGFNEMETIHETGFASGAPTEEEIKKLAKSERLAVHISNATNLVLFVAKVYASMESRSMAVIASTLDSLLDLLSGFILWFTANAMSKPNHFHYPIGKRRMQPVGIIVFASVMATLGLQVLLESGRQLVVSNEGVRPPILYTYARKKKGKGQKESTEKDDVSPDDACLVKEDDRDAPSFLFESVEPGLQASNIGRYSVVGAQPTIEIVAKGNVVTVMDHGAGRRTVEEVDDPMMVPQKIMEEWEPQRIDELPEAFCGGWVGYFSYDTVRYVEKKKLPFSNAPEDDRSLPDVHLGLYDDVIVFDHVEKKAYVIHWVRIDKERSVEDNYTDGMYQLESLVSRIQDQKPPKMPTGFIKLRTEQFGPKLEKSTMTSEAYKEAVLEAKEHILAGDIFQIVLSQRFERRTFADPFEIYRALRIVNPSPYMAYLQARGCILVASSPEILLRSKTRRITNRPLAGTVRRGKSPKEDLELEKELLSDEKQCAEHIMLVDLGRNDVGKVSKPGSVEVEKLMNVERYSHVMHISSTVKGELLDDLTSWDALRAALPVGTVSGAPKVKAMELIDELEVTRRGPYSGGFGGISFNGDMDIALALRTMVFPTNTRYDTLYSYKHPQRRREWIAHIQAGAGVVADSNPDDEQKECENKAAALARAIDLAESSFLEKPEVTTPRINNVLE